MQITLEIGPVGSSGWKSCYNQAGGSPQLKNVSFEFGRGARILVVGANGAGKSTLLSILGTLAAQEHCCQRSDKDLQCNAECFSIYDFGRMQHVGKMGDCLAVQSAQLRAPFASIIACTC